MDKTYYSAISNWDKALTTTAFAIVAKDNQECVIIVATDAYGMGIDNPDVKLVIQWDIPMSFDSMIQCMGRAGRKEAQSTFVLFTPNWSKVIDANEIEIQKSKKDNTSRSAQLSDSNRPVAQQASLLCLVSNAQEEDESDVDSITGLQADSFTYSEAEGYDIEDADLFSGFFITDADENHLKKKKQCHVSKMDAQKRAKLPDEIFDYIHVARCRRLFSLAWYGDMMYAEEASVYLGSTSNNLPFKKPLPTHCCNGPSCMSPEPDYLQRGAFIDDTSAKYTEGDQEQIACRTTELKKWRKKASIRLWKEKRVVEEMPDNALMSNSCLLALVKDGGLLHDIPTLLKFLKPWSQRIFTYADEILLCLQKYSPLPNGPLDPTIVQPTKAKRKAILKAARTSKKLKYMDDLLVAKQAWAVELRDKQLIEKGKAPPDTKAQMKKAADAKRKLIEKQTKGQEKAKNKGKTSNMDMMRLALANRQAEAGVGSFRDVFSNLVTGNNNKLEGSPASGERAKQANSERQIVQQKKKANLQSRAIRLGASLGSNTTVSRPPTPTPVQMELI